VCLLHSFIVFSHYLVVLYRCYRLRQIKLNIFEKTSCNEYHTLYVARRLRSSVGFSWHSTMPTPISSPTSSRGCRCRCRRRGIPAFERRSRVPYTPNNNNNIDICIAPYGRNFRGAGPGSVLVGVRRGKRVSLREEKCQIATLARARSRTRALAGAPVGSEDATQSLSGGRVAADDDDVGAVAWSCARRLARRLIDAHRARTTRRDVRRSVVCSVVHTHNLLGRSVVLRIAFPFLGRGP